MQIMYAKICFYIQVWMLTIPQPDKLSKQKLVL